MRNCLVMGCGRSGTSLVGGILHQAGYNLGEKLVPANESNPKGFFEWPLVNRINEEILAPFGGGAAGFDRAVSARGSHDTVRPGYNQHWLLALPKEIRVEFGSGETKRKIKEVLSHEPYAYKDPRFCYTLPVWQAYLHPSTRIICVFRHPGATITSILKECQVRSYLANFLIDEISAFQVWTCMYSRVIEYQRMAPERFFFVHCNQLISAKALTPMAEFLAVRIDAGFADKTLQRSSSSLELPPSVELLYHRLCDLAGYDENQ